MTDYLPVTGTADAFWKKQRGIIRALWLCHNPAEEKGVCIGLLLLPICYPTGQRCLHHNPPTPPCKHTPSLETLVSGETWGLQCRATRVTVTAGCTESTERGRRFIGWGRLGCTWRWRHEHSQPDSRQKKPSKCRYGLIKEKVRWFGCNERDTSHSEITFSSHRFWVGFSH